MVQVIGLAAGQPDFATPAAIADAGKAAVDAGKTTYTPNTGTPALRAAIADKLRTDNGLEYGADEVVVSNGAKQSIWQAVLACVSPGDEVIVPAPYWVSYPEMVKLAGGVPVVVASDAAAGFLMSAAQLEAALTERTRLVILCTPSNPSGAVYSRAGLEALAAVVARHPRALVVSDEIYELITYPPAEHVSFAALPGMWERTITVNGVSKAFAMTGWRIGYAAAPRHFAAAMAVIQSQSTSGACSISQVRRTLLVSALEHAACAIGNAGAATGRVRAGLTSGASTGCTPQRHHVPRRCVQEASVAALRLGPHGGEPVAHMVEEFQRRRDYIVGRLQAMEGLRVATPQGAFYVLPDCAACMGEGAHAEGWGPVPDADALCRYLLEVGRVACVPGTAFGAPQCIRISYAASLKELEEAADRIERCLDASRLRRPT